VRFNVWKVLLLLLMVAPSAQAQLWRGPAAVEIRVEDQKGFALAGAQVRLLYKSVDPKDGPPPVTTDAKGRVNVSGLAEGPWSLEVSQQGYMTFLAEIAVREGGRIQVSETAQLNVPGALRFMEVRVAKGRREPGSRETALAEKAPAPAPRPAEPAPAPAPPVKRAEPAPSQPPAPRPEPRPQPETPRETPKETPPAPAPEPRMTPPSAPAPAPAPVEKPQPPVESAPKPAPQQPAPRPMPQQPVPQPTPQQPTVTPPATVPPPAPKPAPQPPAPQPDPVRLRTHKDRTCIECPPGESAMSTERLVTAGAGSCGTDIASRLQGGAIPTNLPDGCHVLRVTLPAGARYTGYRFDLQDGGNTRDCLAGRDCTGGGGRWPMDPVLVRNSNETVILAPFESGAGERERRAVLTVYFSAGRSEEHTSELQSHA